MAWMQEGDDWWAGYRRRFSTMNDMCGPPSWKTLTRPPSAIEEALAAKAAGKVLSPADSQLLAASVHPDTGKVIPLPLRMSAHVPMNTILLMGMLSARSPVGTAVWQLCNQAFNAAQFFANKNHSNQDAVSSSRLALSFGVSTVSATVVGYMLRRAADQAAAAGTWAGRRLWWLQVAVPLLAAAAGKPLQIGVMRSDELLAGVQVQDEEGRDLGLSRRAGLYAVATTILTRVTYLVQPMLMPPVIVWGVSSLAARSLAGRALLQRRLLGGRVTGRAALENCTLVASVAASSALMTPLCIALFEPRAALPLSAVEPEVQAEWKRRHPDGGDEGTAATVYFNKGL